MNRDDIIRIAQEAGAFFDGDCSVYDMPEHCFEKFAALVAAAERESIAKMFDRNALYYLAGSEMRIVQTANAAAIRARGEV